MKNNNSHNVSNTKRPDSHSSELHSGYISGVTFTNKKIQFEIIDGRAIFEGDIDLGPADEILDSSLKVDRMSKEQKNNLEADRFLGKAVTVSAPRYRWTRCIIPYSIANDVPTPERINTAIQHWELNTPLRFIPYSNQVNYVEFVRHPNQGSNVSSSAVGMTGGRQEIRLNDGHSAGIIIHEIGHLAGLWHEQSRQDRDSFIEINWSNITNNGLQFSTTRYRW